MREQAGAGNMGHDARARDSHSGTSSEPPSPTCPRPYRPPLAISYNHMHYELSIIDVCASLTT